MKIKVESNMVGSPTITVIPETHEEYLNIKEAQDQLKDYRLYGSQPSELVIVPKKI